MADNVSSKYNMRSPAVKRICQEIKELQRDGDAADFMAEALESDIFEWHFVVRGPPGTEFEGGVYHGRVLLPPEYPFKPPSFMMLTPSGRFETGVKICLSISSHHPEHWQPSWSVRTALTALIAFMPSPGQGALGSLDFTKEERKQLAARSRIDVPKFGSPARQKIIDDMHKAMLQRLQQQQEGQGQQQHGSSKQALQQPSDRAPETTDTAGAAAAAPAPQSAAAPKQAASPDTTPAAARAAAPAPAASERSAGAGTSSSDVDAPDLPAGDAPRDVAELQQWLHRRKHRMAAELAAASAAGDHALQPQQQRWPPAAAQQQQQQPQQQQSADAISDRGLALLAFVLSLAIAALLLKKVAGAWGGLGEIAASVSNF